MKRVIQKGDVAIKEHIRKLDILQDSTDDGDVLVRIERECDILKTAREMYSLGFEYKSMENK